MKLCIALDNNSKEENLKLAYELEEFANDLWLKVGLRSYIRDNNEFLFELKNLGFKIFLDLKLYDIPNTIATATEEIAKLNIDMFNIHASAGKEAIIRVRETLDKFSNPPLVLAVTALTSFDEKSFREIYNDSIENKVKYFAKISYENGLDGVVCSAFESKMIKDLTNQNFITLSPGIRPFKENSNNDQKRVANIEFAKKNLVDFIVVGRPIYQSKNPKEVVFKILKEIK